MYVLLPTLWLAETQADNLRTLVGQFVQNRLIVLPADPSAPKAPATIVRTTEDKKSVVLSL
jgi:hypothetical protein